MTEFFRWRRKTGEGSGLIISIGERDVVSRKERAFELG